MTKLPKRLTRATCDTLAKVQAQLDTAYSIARVPRGGPWWPDAPAWPEEPTVEIKVKG